MLQMMRNDSEWIADVFAASARDCTPESARHVACVLFAPFSCGEEVSSRCSSLLSEHELSRADHFVTDQGRAHFKQRRAFRRYCGALALGSQDALSRVVFEETEKGRPYLSSSPDVWFSFSSCPSGFLGAWSRTYRIGVDLEDQTRRVEAMELAQRYFSKAETEIIEGLVGQARLTAFFQFWCLKEAALKSIGEGLPFGLDMLTFELVPNLRVVDAPYCYGGPEQFSAHAIDGTGRCAALIIRENDEVPKREQRMASAAGR
jgi:phosphopantetheinyl transferase